MKLRKMKWVDTFGEDLLHPKTIGDVYVHTEEELKELLQKHFAEGHYMGQLYKPENDRFSLEASFEHYWSELMKEQE